MYKDYLDDVVSHYRKGQRNADLPQRLMQPTPASIRDECMAVCEARFAQKDLRILKAFFGVENDKEKILSAIYQFDINRLKPLAKFLKGGTRTTDDLNIELLAWLMDFPKRPEDYIGILTDEVGESLRALPKDKGLTVKPIPVLSVPRKVLVALAAAVLLLTSVSFYFVGKKDMSFGVVNSGAGCMLWVGDHYIPTSCGRHGDTLVVALDADKVKNFRRITNLSTISMSSLGKVWYIKRDGGIECYTQGGAHPLEPKKRLHPLTKYMVQQHFSPWQP